MIKQFIAFLCCGVVATTAHYALLIALVELVSLNPVLSSGLGFFLGFIVGFILNNRLVFQHNGSNAAVVRYFVMAVVVAILNISIVWFLINIEHCYYLLAQLIATGVAVVLNYFCCREWVFK